MIDIDYIDLILLDEYNRLDLESKKLTTRKAKEEIIKNLEGLCILSDSYARAFTLWANKERREAFFANVFSFFGHMQNSVAYGVCPAYRGKEIVILDTYSASTARAAIDLDFVISFKNKVVIKECINCGRYFIPSTRSDEIYCDNIFRNGKTCKQIGYSVKVESDSILKKYRTIYKTQNARKQRNRDNVANISERFEIWSDYAKKQLQNCRASVISLAEMEDRISRDDWMRGGIIDGKYNPADK